MWKQALHIFAKDLRVEWRTREIIYTMVLFAVLLVVIFSFAFSDDSQASSGVAGVAGGVLWVAVAFSGTLGLGRIFERERESETITALLISPVHRGAIYLGKLMGTLVYMTLTEAVVVPLLLLMFAVPIGSPGLFITLLALGTLGFAAVGSLFAASLMRVRSREVLLGILTYPIVMPVIVAGTKGTAALMTVPADPSAALLWIQLLATFDLMFVTLAVITFGPLVSAD